MFYRRMASATVGVCKNCIIKKKQGIWLVGGLITEITGSKLPSNRQVLGRFLYIHSKEKQTVHCSATTTARELCIFWNKARIPMRQECHVINKIKDLHARWQSLKKNASRRTDCQQRKEDVFVNILDDLFDIAHSDAMTLIQLSEDRDFLVAQREKGRRGTMGSVDKNLTMKEERRRQRDARRNALQQKEANRSLTETTAVQQTSSQESSADDDSDEASSDEADDDDSDEERIDDDEFTAPAGEKSRRSRPSSIVNPEVAAALDRTRVSDRNAAFVLAAAAQSLGHNPADIALNRESIRRARRRHRELIAKEIRESFAPTIPLTIHWDGKILPSLTSKDTVDRLAVLVSGEGGVMKLL